jgi:hypothetical protein
LFLGRKNPKSLSGIETDPVERCRQIALLPEKPYFPI